MSNETVVWSVIVLIMLILHTHTFCRAVEIDACWAKCADAGEKLVSSTGGTCVCTNGVISAPYGAD